MGVCWGRFYGDSGITDLEIFKNPTSWPSPTGTWLISGFHSLWMLGFLIYDTKLRLLQSSHSVMSDSLRTPGPQHSRIPCPSPTLRAYSNSCPLSRWYHPTISSSVVPFSSCLQSFPASGSFPMSQLFASGGQSIGVSASASVLPMNSQDWSPLGWTGCSPRDSQESSPTPQFKSINSSALSFLHSPNLISIRDHWKNHSLE